MAEPIIADQQRRAQAALADSPIFDLRRLCVESVDGRIIISGRVASFYHKQMAQEVVQSVLPDMEVVNQADVPEYVSPVSNL